MKIVKPYCEILSDIDSDQVLKQIERAARTCYKSEDKIDDESAMKTARGLVSRKHGAMLEHAFVTVKFVVDRGVTHEIVRHRIASFAQESTRYCNYSKGKYGEEITVIEPFFFEPGTLGYMVWEAGCQRAEAAYLQLLSNGCTPQEARAVLPNSLKTELVMTANMREWRHFFGLRAIGTTGAPHPQMQEVALPLLRTFQERIPVLFDDLTDVQNTNLTDEQLAAIEAIRY